MILLILYLWNNPRISSQAALNRCSTCWNNDSFKPFLTFYFILDCIMFGEVKQSHAAVNVKKWVKRTSWWLLLNIGICLCNSGSVLVLSQDVAVAVLLQLLILGLGIWSREESLFWKEKKGTKEGQVNYSLTIEIKGVLKLYVKKIPVLLASKAGWHHSLCHSESFMPTVQWEAIEQNSWLKLWFKFSKTPETMKFLVSKERIGLSLSQNHTGGCGKYFYQAGRAIFAMRGWF